MQHERIVPILGVWDTQEQDTIFCMISPWISDCQLDHYVASAGCQKLEALVLVSLGRGCPAFHANDL